MSIHIAERQIVSSGNYHFWQSSSKMRQENALGAILELLGVRSGSMKVEKTSEANRKKISEKLSAWVSDGTTRRYKSLDGLADALAKELGIGRRENAFFQQDSENKNVHTVIHHQVLSNSSVGWSEQRFFAELGDPRHKVGTHARNAEQEYLLQNMVKGALFEAAQIADEKKAGIAVRGTGLLAHMGIESGNPTKAQEFKNKTSKELDLWLCDEMTYGDIGAVMHYDPRVGWRSGSSGWKLFDAETKENKEQWASDFDKAWEEKRKHIEKNRINQLRGLGDRITIPKEEAHWTKLKDWFKSRLNEYREEHPEYTTGHYKDHVKLVGPFIHLKDRPDVHMYGDHDLFAFTRNAYGRIVHDSLDGLVEVQKALQDANTFQAQHGGIWNWKPAQEFHVGIKKKIMGAHSPPDGEPLVYILPGYVVSAAFYIPAASEQEEDKLVSVWDRPEATAWLNTTYSGKELLKALKTLSDANRKV